MKGSNIVLAFQHLRMAKDFFQDFQRAHPGTKGANLFEGYNRKIDWIYKDVTTHPTLPAEAITGIKEEWASDVYAVDAIAEKVALLNPQQREAIEKAIELVLAGEEINIEFENKAA